MQTKQNSRTPLKDLGEFKLIEHLTKDFTNKNTSTIKGVGDDSAVVKHDLHTVVTTDLLVEGIHFDLVYTPLNHLGYKSVMVNLSDIYAMNAQPKQITVSIAVSSKFSVEHISELYSGIYLACEKYGVDLIGGDTTSSLTGLVISITALGTAPADKIVFRSGAKVNDLICVSGDLGAAYIGLQLLEREKKIFEQTKGVQPQFGEATYVLARQLKPEARRDIIETLEKLDILPTSMIDVSDGLSSEILHLCKQSNTGCKIYQDKIPIDKETGRIAEEMNLIPLTAALNGGEDYELLFTVPLTKLDKLIERTDIRIIGHICDVSEGTNLILSSGSETPIKAQGWASV